MIEVNSDAKSILPEKPQAEPSIRSTSISTLSVSTPALSSQQLKQILAKALPGHTLCDAQLQSKGFSNITYWLKVDGLDQNFALRVYRRDPLSFHKELFLHRLLAGHAPVPSIIYASEQTEDCAPYVLMTWIEAITFWEFKKSGPRIEDFHRACRSVGETLARTTAFTFPAGEDDVLPTGPFGAGTASIPLQVEHWLTSPILARRLPLADRDRIPVYMSRFPDLFADLERSRALVHADFSNRNILVRNDTGKWQVAAVLDWEFAFIGSPLWDIGHFLRYERRVEPFREPHFSMGFRDKGGKLPDDWRELTLAIDLVRNLHSLASPELPESVVDEITGLIRATITRGGPDNRRT
jgi:aminoglycoside phosphotransferase (APT) family kinase protein